MVKEKKEKTEEEKKEEEVKGEVEGEVKEVREQQPEKPAETKQESAAEIQSKEEKTADDSKMSGDGGEKEPTGKFRDLIRQIESLSVLDLAELVKALEERFGVSAAAPVAVAAAGPSAGATTSAAPEEKTNFSVVLVNPGDLKINVIKVVREITGLGLKEAKDLVDAAPKAVKENVPKAEAEEIKKKLEEAGAQVELK